MTIRYYVHAWQGLAMFLAGIVSVLAAFAGYIQSGGGEELLRRELAHLQTGRAQFDTISFKWKTGEMVVTNLRHDSFSWPKKNPVATFSGLLAKEMTVKMDLLPWPPAVQSITIRGMPDTAIAVSAGFLQTGKVQALRYNEIPPIRFLDCNLDLKIGVVGPLKLSGCSGELRRGTGSEPPRGAFSLRELDGRPFNFKLETLEDGRWVFTGDEIQINTRAIKAPSSPFAAGDQLDPVGLLVRALFSGDMGAEGTVTALRLAVQPATAVRKFVCDGEVGYRNLEFRLPKPTEVTGLALPGFLDKLLGAGENLWPRWMQVDSIKSGESGRVTFHMSDGRLNFACDEGPGSAFTGTRQGQVFPPLESLKGAVVTDADNRPQRILLRGFLGQELSFETHVEHNPDKSRAYQLLLEPRPAAPAGGKTGVRQPLWRFASRVTDYLDATQLPPKDEAGEQAKVEFEVESDARHFPWPEWLPPGMRDISGHMYAKGRFTNGRRLHLDPLCLDDGGTLVYGGVPAPAGGTGDFGPLWQSLYSLFGTRTPWELQDVALRGRAEVQFSPDLRWETTTLKDFTLTSGSLVHAGLTSDWGVASPSLTASHKRDVNVSEITVRAFVAGKWHLRFSGDWKQEDGQPVTGMFRLVEQDVPFVLHPQRESLRPEDVSPDRRRVNRTTIVRVNGDKVANEEKP